MKLLVFIPCYNEEDNLESLIERIDECLNGYSYMIMALDDGSVDNTGKILRRLQAKYPMLLLQHEQNRGLSEAFKTGISNLISISGAEDIIVTMDADLTHDPSYIPTMFNKLQEGFDVVVASRYTAGGKQIGVSTQRELLSKGVNWLNRVVTGTSIKDMTSSYRCYRASAMKKIYDVYGEKFIEAKGFEAAFEILAKAIMCGAKVAEIPFTLDYNKKKGRSKMKLWETIILYLRLHRSLKAEHRYSVAYNANRPKAIKAKDK